MSTIHKCDRCGRLFEDINQEIGARVTVKAETWKYSGNPTSIAKTNLDFQHNDYELCNQCAEKLAAFLKELTQ
jgi:hypothetical protein